MRMLADTDNLTTLILQSQERLRKIPCSQELFVSLDYHDHTDLSN